MTSVNEKRRTDRYTVEAPILCSYFNMPVSSSAKAINYGQDGMDFVSDMAFHLGSAVLIQVKNGSSHQKIPENTTMMRQTALAEVRWCKSISENPVRYQIGVKYYESWY
ncbi:MAG: hypothetical protein NTU74_20625 [Deltaproteobacteria bacterium]|jgi:hypothetical protein|nr:hypothetical protein [Deltaproteobacteria bacterium]